MSDWPETEEAERLAGALERGEDADPDRVAAVLRGLAGHRDAYARMDREAATHVESVICMRTDFTGDPPYVGWRGLGQALKEALDDRDRLREVMLRTRREATWPNKAAADAALARDADAAESFRFLAIHLLRLSDRADDESDSARLERASNLVDAVEALVKDREWAAEAIAERDFMVEWSVPLHEDRAYVFIDGPGSVALDWNDERLNRAERAEAAGRALAEAAEPFAAEGRKLMDAEGAEALPALDKYRKLAEALEASGCVFRAPDGGGQAGCAPASGDPLPGR